MQGTDGRSDGSGGGDRASLLAELKKKDMFLQSVRERHAGALQRCGELEALAREREVIIRQLRATNSQLAASLKAAHSNASFATDDASGTILEGMADVAAATGASAAARGPWVSSGSAPAPGGKQPGKDLHLVKLARRVKEAEAKRDEYKQILQSTVAENEPLRELLSSREEEAARLLTDAKHTIELLSAELHKKGEAEAVLRGEVRLAVTAQRMAEAEARRAEEQLAAAREEAKSLRDGRSQLLTRTVSRDHRIESLTKKIEGMTQRAAAEEAARRKVEDELAGLEERMRVIRAKNVFYEQKAQANEAEIMRLQAEVQIKEEECKLMAAMVSQAPGDLLAPQGGRQSAWDTSYDAGDNTSQVNLPDSGSTAVHPGLHAHSSSMSALLEPPVHRSRSLSSSQAAPGPGAPHSSIKASVDNIAHQYRMLTLQSGQRARAQQQPAVPNHSPWTTAAQLRTPATAWSSPSTAAGSAVGAASIRVGAGDMQNASARNRGGDGGALEQDDAENGHGISPRDIEGFLLGDNHAMTLDAHSQRLDIDAFLRARRTQEGGPWSSSGQHAHADFDGNKRPHSAQQSAPTGRAGWVEHGEQGKSDQGPLHPPGTGHAQQDVFDASQRSSDSHEPSSDADTKGQGLKVSLSSPSSEFCGDSPHPADASAGVSGRQDSGTGAMGMQSASDMARVAAGTGTHKSLAAHSSGHRAALSAAPGGVGHRTRPGQPPAQWSGATDIVGSPAEALVGAGIKWTGHGHASQHTYHRDQEVKGSNGQAGRRPDVTSVGTTRPLEWGLSPITPGSGERQPAGKSDNRGMADRNNAGNYSETNTEAFQR
eukprot:jgi/Mesvir1/4827/Mv11114-RA.2